MKRLKINQFDEPRGGSDDTVFALAAEIANGLADEPDEVRMRAHEKKVQKLRRRITRSITELCRLMGNRDLVYVANHVRWVRHDL